MHVPDKKENIISARCPAYLSIGYFLIIAKINSQQEKPTVLIAKVSLRKNKLPQKISCHTLETVDTFLMRDHLISTDNVGVTLDKKIKHKIK